MEIVSWRYQFFNEERSLWKENQNVESTVLSKPNVIGKYNFIQSTFCEIFWIKDENFYRFWFIVKEFLLWYKQVGENPIPFYISKPLLFNICFILTRQK